MADRPVFAFTALTPPGGYYPEYISINEHDGKLALSVRSEGSQSSSVIALTEQQVRDLQRALFEWLPGSVVIDGATVDA